MREGFGDNEISILAREEERDRGHSSGEQMSYADQNLSDGTMAGGAFGRLAGRMGAGALLIRFRSPCGGRPAGRRAHRRDYRRGDGRPWSITASPKRKAAIVDGAWKRAG